MRFLLMFVSARIVPPSLSDIACNAGVATLWRTPISEAAVDRTGQHAVSFTDDTTWRDPADAAVFTVFRRMHSTPGGLTEREAADRLRQCGENEPPRLADERFAARVGDAVR